MKIAKRKLLICLICLQVLTSSRAPAQDEARAAWQVTNFDITVANPGADRVLNARAVLSLQNIGRGAGSTLSLRINPKAEIKSVTIGSALVTYQSRPESRGNAQRTTITLPNSVAANEKITATIEYRLPVGDNAGTAAISPIGSQFLPPSMWFPIANNAFAVRGADSAPFRLTINGAPALSSGVEKSAGGNSVFEQPLNAQPFFAIGAWDRIDGGSNARDIAAYLPKGAPADERKQAEVLITLAKEARAFYSSMLGTAPSVPIRLIATSRGGGFDDAGAILLSEGSFRRQKIDSLTALSIGESIARLWIGAETPVRGEGHGVVSEGLPRFLATLFIEKQFGIDAADAERTRQRLAYATIAKRDGPLSRTTPMDTTYFNSVANKGAMVWRLIDHLIGRDAFTSTLRRLLANGKNDADGFSLAQARSAFAERGGASVKVLLDQELDQPTDMDLMAGLPHQEGGQWTAALRNLGSIEATVNVVGWTAAGQQIATQGTIPPHDFAQANFKSVAVVRVEIDPEKFYPQLDYANDVAPRIPDLDVSLAEANRLFGAQEFAKSEALARQMLAASPRFQEARIVLGRALLAQNRNDDAEREFKQLLDERLPIPSALAWANIGLGEIALRRGQAAEASRDFTDAIHVEADYASMLAARAARIRAESTGAAAPPVDESAKAFIAQLDSAIRTGREENIAPSIVPGELTRFEQQIVGTQPEAWQTQLLRTESLDANRMAVDVSLNTKQLGVEHSGTAVFILARVGGSWKLDAIELFEVR